MALTYLAEALLENELDYEINNKGVIKGSNPAKDIVTTVEAIPISKK